MPRVKTAFTVAELEPTAAWHVGAVPLQPPLQPENVEPAFGVAVRVTIAPQESDIEQTEPHWIPPDVPELTVPVPVPLLVTVRVGDAQVEVKVAVTERAWVMVTAQVEAVPLQAPLQPLKVEPEPEVEAAVRVTTVPVV